MEYILDDVINSCKSFSNISKTNESKIYLELHEKNHLLLTKEQNVILDTNTLKPTLEELNKYHGEENYIYKKDSLKMLISRTYSLDKRPITKVDEENGITYSIDKLSREHILWFILRNSENEILYYGGPRYKSEKEIDLLDWFADNYRFRELSVKTKRNIPKERLISLAKGFIYNLHCCGYDPVIANINYQKSHFYDSRRDVSKPQKLYNDKLIDRYIFASSSGNPVTEYLYYYNIIEFFFISITNKFLVTAISKRVADPRFSHNNTDAITDIINTVNEFNNISNSERSNEKLSLRKCLEEFVDVDHLQSKLKMIHEDLLEYYKKQKVNLKKGQIGVPINFTHSESVYSNLSERIYQIRNSIVHGKESNDKKVYYTPFIDDGIIEREVFLVKAIAEQVIYANSEEINL